MRIMLVDDEAMVLDFYTTVLEENGYSVIQTRNGEEAVNVYKDSTLKNEKPNLIIMDYRMPRKNGIEATREILSFDPSARIIFASADECVLKKAEGIGALVSMAKPFGIEKLLSNIKMVSAL